MSPLTLSTIPGFSDLSNTPLAANKFSIGAHLSAINFNASFGIVRLEIFTDIYKHGDTVPLPKSVVDGYTYRQDELLYMWVPQNTANPTTGWATYREPWTMWYGIWNVNQLTGLVSSEIGYRGNNDHKDNQASTNDGVVQVFVIAQRQKASMIMSAAPSFVRHLDADFFTNKALNTGLLTELNGNAKFAIVNTEIIYCGEYFNGQTVTQPQSPVDGHLYAYADCIFQTSWRWTADTDGSGNPIKPAINKGQLQDWSASVSVSGAVRIANTSVSYELSGTHTGTTGKVAVFAFCNRPLGTTFPSSVNLFAEVLDSLYAPGQTLRATTLQQTNRNINQAICTPEFFGPTNYANGATIPVPTSPLDAYVYARNELFYIWDWANTGPSANASGRLSLVHGSISATGVVTINDYRFNSGASAVTLANEGSMRVIVVGMRSRTLASPPVSTPGPPTFGVDDVIEFYGPNDRQTQYLNKADGSVTVSSLLNSQGSVLPNQVIALTFTMPSSSVLICTFADQSLLRPDNTNLNLLGSNTAANLSVNGDFEAAGTLGAQAANWSLSGGNALVKDNSAIFSGSFNGKINNAGGATSQNQSTATIALTGGQVYVLEAVIKVATAMPNVPAHVGACVDLIIATGITSFTIITKFGAWEGTSPTTPRMGWPADGNVKGFGFFQCYFIPTANGTVNINCLMQSNGGDAEFDNIKLYPFRGKTYTGLSASTHYYLYPYIEVATGLLKFRNGAPPGSSPSDVLAAQCLLDGGVQVAPKNILTPTAGGSSSDTGGGSGTCPEWKEPVYIRRYSNLGELLFEGEVEAGDVKVGFESDDGLILRGDMIKGWSFAKQKFVWRAVQKVIIVPCSAWSQVRGRLLTPCEAVWWENGWMAAWKTPGARHVKKISFKVLIEVEADWDDEHNYLVGDLIIHNMIVLPC